MTVTIQGGQVTFKPFTWVLEFSRTLGAFSGYQQATNDPLAADPTSYFVSRCIDAYLSAAMTYVRWERCRIVEVSDVQHLAAASSVVRQAAAEHDAVVLSAVIRPALELHVDLCLLREYSGNAALVSELCRHMIHKQLVGDWELRQKACEKDYGCRPSYFALMLKGHRPVVQGATSSLAARGVDVLAGQSRKRARALRVGSFMDRIVLGPDSFSAEAQLAYKLHFLPQKGLPLGEDVTSFMRNWCAWLLVAAGIRLTQLADLPLPANLSAIESAFEEFSGEHPAPNAACPSVGDILLLSWGVGLVEDVDRRPSGNEVLTLRYDIPFVEGLVSPDKVPRRFTNIRLDRERYAGLLVTIKTWFPGVPLPELQAEARATGQMLDVYNALLACRREASDGQRRES